ncbi:MAG: ABC transporter ATP-binding protein [Candidatus Eisenbacteria bacterium]|nr:ABC transporter ATP-binding protein [Candidatus Eisenbacteria bacterium]
MELVIRNISKTYGNGIQALKDVSLTIPTGMFGLVGPNGSGKTTLMRSIATLQAVDSGSIRFNGIDVLTQKEDVRTVLGYLPQDFGVYPGVSAESLLTHFAVLKGITGRGDRTRAVEALLKRTNLWTDRRRKLGTFSGGMRQRFGVAQALLGSPKLIIVDEPTAGLDPEERERFLNLLSEIGENVVVILSTHIIEDVSELCTSMAVIDHGVVRYTGSPREAIAGIRGTTWRREVDRAELAEIERNHTVLSKRLAGGTTIIHVSSARQPDPSFEAVEPDLRDVYFTYLSHNGQSQ